MALPTFVFESVLTLIFGPLIVLIYFFIFKKSLKKTYSTKKLFFHFLYIIGISTLCIFLSNVIRFIISFSILYLTSYNSGFISNFASLLSILGHNFSHGRFTALIAYPTSIILNILFAYLVVKHFYLKSRLDKTIKNYSIFTALIFNVPTIIWLIWQAYEITYFAINRPELFY